MDYQKIATAAATAAVLAAQQAEQPKATGPLAYDLREVSRRCSCSVMTIRRMVQRKQLPAFHLGKRSLRVPADAVARLLAGDSTMEKPAPVTAAVETVRLG